ncbi:MAG: class I SAM-dependent methyltransferase [Candidatus Accumulibacter sp.]|uniref:class I SAM-dependent methyltransferase n=1 Tax=Accumulibacter sp. TaxID=2053492 RepID=UPI001AC98B52|nr:class I SAM-dependent methyltransferase [Accumulibacter sp.]MBN8438411.1 class I SAM-dependent methyltransferase [Accumulibacter sp.]
MKISSVDIEIAAGEPGGRLIIAADHVLRRIDRTPWREVEPLLAHIVTTDHSISLVGWQQVSADAESVTLRHPRLRQIAYPHEWCAEMLLEAARLHCRLLAAIAPCGFTLKDAHPWNVLFDGIRPVFVDIGSVVPVGTLSKLDYLRYRPRRPLAAAVFHLMFLPFFVCPLAFHQAGLGNTARQVLWAYALNSTHRLPRLTDYLSMVPPRHWHRFARAVLTMRQANRKFNKVAAALARDGSLSQFAAGLSSIVESLAPLPASSAYTSYYAAKGEEHDFDITESWNAKQINVKSLLAIPEIVTVLDIACNTGWYARLAARLGKRVTAVDVDAACIGALYRTATDESEDIVPLVANILAPSPARHHYNGGLLLIDSSQRLGGDAVLALGILHHLVLGSGMALRDALRRLAAPAKRLLIVEFVALEDSVVVDEPGFFAAFSRNREDFAGYSLQEACAALDVNHWDVKLMPSYPSTRTLLVCSRRVPIARLPANS